MEKFAQIGQARSDPVYGEYDVSSRVSGLLLLCGPPAVRRTVRAAVVDPFKRASVRPVTHVFVEQRKVFPPITNRNPTTSVIAKGSRLGVSASVQHGLPNPIQVGFLSFSSTPMLDKCAFYPFISGKHNVGSFNVVFSGGRPATTGAHCDILTVSGKEHN